MKHFFTIYTPILLITVSCMTQGKVDGSFQSTALQAKSSFLLTNVQRTKIARKIWKNESSETIEGLTAWNEGEGFPSLGIGHFIWYPKGIQGPFTESFPQFVAFAKQQGKYPPAIARNADAPWPSREVFKSQFNSLEMIDLRNWLANNLTLQADFIIAKSQASLGKILNAASSADRARIQANYQKVSATPNGQYALIDYVNFKGEGINPKERYNGQGWGLMQVLLNMQSVPGGQPAAAEFAKSAKRTLGQRIDNSPKDRGEKRWKSGWFNRCETYARPL